MHLYLYSYHSISICISLYLFYHVLHNLETLSSGPLRSAPCLCRMHRRLGPSNVQRLVSFNTCAAWEPKQDPVRLPTFLICKATNMAFLQLVFDFEILQCWHSEQPLLVTVSQYDLA